MKHTFLANYYVQNRQDNEQKAQNQFQEPKQWYETIGGLIILSIGLDLVSSLIYDVGRNQFQKKFLRKQRLKDIDFLEKYEGKTQQQAELEVDTEEAKVDKKILN